MPCLGVRFPIRPWSPNCGHKRMFWNASDGTYLWQQPFSLQRSCTPSFTVGSPSSLGHIDASSLKRAGERPDETRRAGRLAAIYQIANGRGLPARTRETTRADVNFVGSVEGGREGFERVLPCTRFPISNQSEGDSAPMETDHEPPRRYGIIDASSEDAKLEPYLFTHPLARARRRQARIIVLQSNRK